MTRQEVMDKVRKLLNLTQSPVPAEAARALAAAQRLMAKYDIASSELTEEELKVEHEEFETSTKGVSASVSSLVNALASHYRCVCYLSRSYKGTRLMIAGYPNDVKLFKDVAFYAVGAQERCFKEFLKTQNTRSRSESIRLKNTYSTGFISGMIKALEENENRYALMVMPSKEVVDVLSGMHAKSSQRSFANSDQARLAGYRDGMDSLKLRNTITA